MLSESWSLYQEATLKAKIADGEAGEDDEDEGEGEDSQTQQKGKKDKKVGKGKAKAGSTNAAKVRSDYLTTKALAENLVKAIDTDPEYAVLNSESSRGKLMEKIKEMEDITAGSKAILAEGVPKKKDDNSILMSARFTEEIQPKVKTVKQFYDGLVRMHKSRPS